MGQLYEISAKGTTSAEAGFLRKDTGSMFSADWPASPTEFMGQSRILEYIDIPNGTTRIFPGPPVDFCGFSALHCVIVGNGRAIQQESETLIATSLATEPVPLKTLLRPGKSTDEKRASSAACWCQRMKTRKITANS